VRHPEKRTAKVVPRRLAPVPLVTFVCRASRKNARQRLSTVRCQTRRTAKVLRRAKCYRAPFAVRSDKKRTAKGLPCVFRPLPCARGPVSRSAPLHTHPTMVCFGRAAHMFLKNPSWESSNHDLASIS
jgi:hypothetical protein